MNQLVVAKRYAQALFRLIQNDADLSKIVLDVLENIHEISQDSFVRSVLISPIVKAETKKDIFDEILSKLNAPDILKNFFGELTQASRVGVVPHLYPVVKELLNNQQGIVDGEIYSVVPLDEKDLQRVRETYQIKLGKKLNLKQVIDPSILGGLKLKVKNHLVDLSLKTDLDQIAKTAVL